MQRAAFKMKLKPGTALEYKKRHDALWPELAEELRVAGVSDYSIFLDEETLTLFAVQKLSEENSVVTLHNSPIVREWWNFMSSLMEVNSDQSPVVSPLKELFHLD